MYIVGFDTVSDRWEIFRNWSSWESGEPIGSAADVRGCLFRSRRPSGIIDGHGGGGGGGGVLETHAEFFRIDEDVATFFD